MATLYVTEFSGLGAPFNGSFSTPQLAAQPPVNEQTVAIGASSTQSAALKNNTSIVRIHTDAICSIEFGTNPTATTSTARMNAGDTEYFSIPLAQSYKVAVISNT